MLERALVVALLGTCAAAVAAEEAVEPKNPRPPQTADEAFEFRAKTLETQIEELKEKIRKAKHFLMPPGPDAAGLTLVHRNDMGSAFVLQSVAYTLNDVPVFTKVDVNGDLSGKPEIEFFDGFVAPGEYRLRVTFVFRGHGFGVFKYLDGYRFNIKGEKTFKVEPGKRTTIRINAFEPGCSAPDIVERLKLGFEMSITPEAAQPRTRGRP